MRLHLVSLPHTETTRAYSWCAYTEKVRKFADMMTSIGHEVVLYGGEANEAACAEHVVTFDRAWQAEHFGGYDWTRDTFNDWNPASRPWQEANTKAVEAIEPRARAGDILAIIGGKCQQRIAMSLPQLVAVEWGIGYPGVFAPFRVFESYAWAHHLAARERMDDLRYFDAIIPNSFEPDAFPLGSGGGDYYLFMGRLTLRKGAHIAVEATKRLGATLVLAGQGVVESSPGRIKGLGVTLEGDHFRHVGLADPARRADLMGGARAVFVPSIYLEPFGGVAVEAMMCGTPVITTDWGAFTETVQHGITGFRCRVLADFVDAGRRAGDLDREAIREYAVTNFSTDVVRHHYGAYLNRLATVLDGEGWYDMRQT